MNFRPVMRRLSTWVLLLLLLHTDIVQGFPNGAGGCAGGEPAVGGYHLDQSDNRTVNSGTFADAGVVVTLDNVVLLPNTDTEDNPQFDIGKDLILRVEVVDFALRGILVRMEAPVDGTLTPGTLLKVAEVCELPILGTTHTNNTDKESVESTVRFDEPVDDVIFDITVVFLNSPAGSVYVYNRFLVNFFEASSLSPSTRVPNVTTPVPSSAATTVAPTPALTTFSPSNGTATVLPTTFAPTTGIPTSLDTDQPSAEATGAPSKPSGEQETPTESKPRPEGGSKRKGGKGPKSNAGSTSKAGKGSHPKGDIANDPSRSNQRDKKKKDMSARQL